MRTAPPLPVARLVGLAIALIAGPVHAQRPAEVSGRVLDANGAPIEYVALELVEAGSRTVSDAAGRYRFGAVSAGRYTVRVSRLGYETRSVVIDVVGGRPHEVNVVLAVAPVPLDAVAVSVTGEPGGGVRIDREEILRSGARSAGEAVRGLPGVVIRSTGAGGPLSASVRGGAPGTVLVVMDGVVLNDPVTGEADLSTVSAGAIESIVLLPGAQSARYGPRAQAGVIVIETRLGSVERELRGSFGSLGARSFWAAWGGATPAMWSAGAEWSSVDGSFDFDLPDEVGGGIGERDNADARTAGAWAGLTEQIAGGTIRLRASGDGTRRGLPGRSYAPSRHARQESERLQATASWRRPSERASLDLSLAGSRTEVRFRDGRPPFGLAYDDTASVFDVTARADAERSATASGGFSVGGGAEARWQSIDATTLDDDFPGRRSEVGFFGRAHYALAVRGGSVELSAQLRADRDDSHEWTTSRSVHAGVTTASGLRASVALRSSYTPPSLADQYFQDAVGVEPNPELSAERVPLEAEADVRLERPFGATRATVGLTAYQGDVRGMIVWAPDFRFVWSPRNVDVKRVGLESRASWEAVDGGFRLRVAHSYTRVVYDRPAGGEDVQVVYRPRHTASAELHWNKGAWRTSLEARFTGARNTVPAPLNTLAPFWTTAVGVWRDWRVAGWTLTPGLRADRLLDEKGSLIFGFPEPGRTLRIELALKPQTPLP